MASEKQLTLSLERGDETLSGESKEDAPVTRKVTQSTEPPWYVIRMPGGVGGEEP